MSLWFTIESEIIKLLPLISAVLIGILGPVGVVYYKHWLYRKTSAIRRKKEDFDHALVIQQSINDSFNKLQARFDLDRLWISLFHNGGNYYPGNKSMKKMSVAFESTAPGVAADILKMQNLPISFFSSYLQKLNTDNTGSGIMVDVYKEEDYALKSYWETKGANTVYLFPIKSLDGLFIAVLGVEFVKRDGELSPDVYREVADEAKLLSGYVAAISVDKS
jgi:hypothetical protein